MLFSTPFFIFAFLPVFFFLYFTIPARRFVLLIASLLFYAWSEPLFILVILASSLIDWQLGKVIFGDGKWRKFGVILGVTSNVLLLLYAKYTIFAVTNLNQLFDIAGWRHLSIPLIALPLGVSFIAFEKITYLVDLYRRSATPAHSLVSYLTYIFLFPKLLAGPIVKYHDIAEQLGSLRLQYDNIFEGVIRFTKGLAKKLLIADPLGAYSDQVFNLSVSSLDTPTAWLGILCFTVQIYFDFSGYSDMAIGLGRILGFRLLENFNNPYLATSFTDFWKRWHISLSSWIKEYVYIPLGGNRVSKVRSYVNLIICFLLSGLWHGASWNFIIWGSLHGLALVGDRAFWLRFQKNIPHSLNVALTFFLIVVTWVFFRCQTFAESMAFLSAMFLPHSATAHEVFMGADVLASLIIGCSLILLPVFRCDKFNLSQPQLRFASMMGVVMLFVLCAGKMSVSTLHPFLYFRF